MLTLETAKLKPEIEKKWKMKKTMELGKTKLKNIGQIVLVQ